MTTTVWPAFAVYGDNDGCLVFDLVGIGETEGAARRLADERFALQNRLETNTITPIHPQMTADTHWTYVGKRDDCTRPPKGLHGYGGFVVEPTTLATATP
jgi:hypothetical protein